MNLPEIVSEIEKGIKMVEAGFTEEGLLKIQKMADELKGEIESEDLKLRLEIEQDNLRVYEGFVSNAFSKLTSALRDYEEATRDLEKKRIEERHKLKAEMRRKAEYQERRYWDGWEDD